MGLPFIQLHEDFLRVGAPMIAAILRMEKTTVIGMGALLFDFAVHATSTEETPPDGIFLDPDATQVLEGAMGTTGEPGRAVDAFIRARVIERLEVGLRVRGMDRYKAAWENSRTRTKKAKTAAGKRWVRECSSDAPAMLGACSSDAPAMLGACSSDAPAMPRDAKREREIEKEIPLLSEEVVGAAQNAPTVPLPKKPGDRFASGESWFAHVQHDRQANGLVVEKYPKHIGAWWSEVGLELSGDFERLEEAYRRFVRDKFWRTKGCPFLAFMKQWRDYVPEKAVA